LGVTIQKAQDELVLTGNVLEGFRPTCVEIDLAALRRNFEKAKGQAGPDRKVLAVVKADAYGHGACRVARVLESAGADMFGVAMVEEGEELRKAGITRPVLILGGIYPGQEEAVFRHKLTPSVFDLNLARRFNRIALESGAVYPFHLKIDTGMGRVGFRPDELPEVLSELSTLSGLFMEGVASHFALADEPHKPFTGEQISLFRQCLELIREKGFNPSFVHIGNSAALFSRDIPECNMVRPGIVLYGALPAPEFAGRIDADPVMSFRTRIAQIKQVPAGTGVSYGHLFRAERPTTLATIPVGYADGFNRRLSKGAEVLVRGKRAKVAGTVCMDWTMLDVTDIPDVAVGDEVTLLGRDNGSIVTAQEWADCIGTIPYEVFCQVSKRVPRFYRE